MTASRAATAQQRRTMAGGHHAAPKWEGLDKTIRDVFPEDWQSELYSLLLQSVKIPIHWIPFRCTR